MKLNIKKLLRFLTFLSLLGSLILSILYIPLIQFFIFSLFMFKITLTYFIYMVMELIVPIMSIITGILLIQDKVAKYKLLLIVDSICIIFLVEEMTRESFSLPITNIHHFINTYTNMMTTPYLIWLLFYLCFCIDLILSKKYSPK